MPIVRAQNTPAPLHTTVAQDVAPSGSAKKTRPTEPAAVLQPASPQASLPTTAVRPAPSRPASASPQQPAWLGVIRLGAPKYPRENPIQPGLAEDWVSSHVPACRPTAQALLDNIQHITFEAFHAKLLDCLADFQAKLPEGEPWVALAEPRRGSGWVLEHALDEMTNPPSSAVDVELMYEFAERVAQSPRMLRHVGLFDDASYSGEQLVERVQDIVDTLADKTSEITIHVVVPFMTEIARRKLAAVQKPDHVKIEIAGAPGRLNSVADLIKEGKFSADQAQMLAKMFPGAGQVSAYNSDRMESVTLAYMAHKVPDGLSCISAVLRNGEVRDEHGHAIADRYPFIPKTIPPYRNTRNW